MEHLHHKPPQGFTPEEALDAANALIVVVSGGGMVLRFNQALSALTSLAAEQVIGTELALWLTPEVRGSVQRSLSRALAGERLNGVELVFSAAPEGVTRARFNLAAVARPGESPEAVVAVGFESAEIRALEHQIIQAEKLATLGQIAAGVVHEINNPLTSISVYADYLHKRLSDEGRPGEVAMLERIMEGAARILKCARDLQNYARPSVLALEPLSLNDVVDQAVSFCEHVIERSGAGLSRSLDERLPSVSGVEDQLLQALINLITNACHALGDGGGEVRLRTADLENGSVQIEVADTGCGIAVDELPRVFEPFFTTKPPGAGTGLGLSIVRKIVDFHGGSIMVASRPGEGATFTITLPIERRDRG